MLEGWSEEYSPFHRGEREMHKRLGVEERQDTMGRRVMRRFMPDQHREFFAQLPFIILGSVDSDGAPWASIVMGTPGFVQTPSDRSMSIHADPVPGDPLQANLSPDAPISLLGIEPPTRRRNRANLRVNEVEPKRIDLRLTMSFGNCPQYIQARETDWGETRSSSVTVDPISRLTEDAAALITKSDTFFVASHNNVDDPETVGGVDVNHRGGKPGFVKVDGDVLTVPDFRGNNAFNTLGNFLVNPRAGLLFLDYDGGDLLQVTGRAEISHENDENVSGVEGAQRTWSVHFEKGHFLRNAIPRNWRFGDYAPQLDRTGIWP